MDRATVSGKSDKRIRVLVADSTRMGAQLLSEVLRRDCRIHVVCTTVGYSEALSALSSQCLDIALISAELDGDVEKGLRLCREEIRSAPRVRVVVLLESSRDDVVVAAFRAGAKGVFFRADSVRPLAKCIHSVHEGQVWAGSRELEFLLSTLTESGSRVPNYGAMANLSQRESQVVRCIADGLTNRQIAERLKLSEHTIKNYIFRIFEKVGMSSRVELIVYALGQFASGVTQEEKNGLLKDGAVSAKWCLEAVRRGSAVMQYRLGEMYRAGLGVPQDNVSAYVWFTLAEVECCKVRKQSHTAKSSLRLEMNGEQIAEAEQRIAAIAEKPRKSVGTGSPVTAAGDDTSLPDACGM
jgi:two-component system nitrate/nitrite response regulator NarL